MNRALAAVGQAGKTKIALPDEDTADARTVRRFYDETLDAFLEEAWWSWATKYSTLSLDSSSAPEQWLYAYKCPIDCVAPRRIVGAVPEEKIEFEEGESEAGIRVLWCDVELAELEYTGRISNFNSWGGLAVRAFGLLLAIDIAPAFTGGIKRVTILEQQYAAALEKAKDSSHNRQERREQEHNEYIQDRHGGNLSPRASARYLPAE